MNSPISVANTAPHNSKRGMLCPVGGASLDFPMMKPMWLLTFRKAAAAIADSETSENVSSSGSGTKLNDCGIIIRGTCRPLNCSK